MMLSGSMASTTKTLRKLCSWSISAVSMRRIITGTTANTDARATALSSTVPPRSMR